MAKYRIKQFYWAVSSFLKKVDEDYLIRYLNQEERALFDKMTRADRHHAIRVAKDAEAYYKSLMKYTDNIEISKEEIIKLSLLHDVGKQVYPLNIINKSIVVLLGKLTRNKLKKLSKFNAVYIYYYHPKEGVKLLKDFGYSNEFLYAVENHHEEDVEETLPLKILKYADNKN
ncbi:HD domain-containing protein [Alloiococcus sp. CFN-8]|uniref:HD domain-containing protein n=1 Tax=Alloiococcus sp. CFN-8 TaxID=3416081 RepID=UPI003CFAB396